MYLLITENGSFKNRNQLLNSIMNRLKYVYVTFHWFSQTSNRFDIPGRYYYDNSLNDETKFVTDKRE